MAPRPRLLILGGTGEARALADRLIGLGRCEIVTSLAGRTAAPLTPAGGLRHGGFGGPDALADYLRDEAIAAVVDATHPFAAQISHHAAQACAARDVPRLLLLRPPWQAERGDRWTQVASPEAAAALLPERGRRVFLGIGRQALAAFADRPGVWYLIRSIEPAATPGFAMNAHCIRARGPFDRDGEAALMREHAIDCLVTRNSGGAATYAKVEAARALGLPAIVIARPPLPDGDTVDEVDDALRWIADKFALDC